MHTLAVESVDLWRQNPLMPPPPGSGRSFKPPAFPVLRMLVEEGITNSLMVRPGLWSRTAANATGGGGREAQSCARNRREEGDSCEGRGELRRREITLEVAAHRMR